MAAIVATSLVATSTGDRLPGRRIVMPTWDSGGSRKWSLGRPLDRHGDVARRAVSPHPVVVKGDMGELRPTIDVTDCVHSVNIGAQLIVGGNVAPASVATPAAVESRSSVAGRLLLPPTPRRRRMSDR